MDFHDRTHHDLTLFFADFEVCALHALQTGSGAEK